MEINMEIDSIINKFKQDYSHIGLHKNIDKVIESNEIYIQRDSKIIYIQTANKLIVGLKF